MHRLKEVRPAIERMGQCDTIDRTEITSISLGTGIAQVQLSVPRALFYQTLSEQSGLEVKDDGDLLQMLTLLSGVKAEYDKVSEALRDVRENGYGIVIPSIDELQLEEPEIMKQGGRYGVKLKASAPSIHMIRADIQTMISPIVGNEKQSEEMLHYLLQEFEGIPRKSGSPTSLERACTSWSTKACTTSCTGCLRTPGSSCRKPSSASSTRAAAG